ncbi:MAG TPA: sigma-70 family RNA polymerase sigma factor [Bacteroides sp.]|nr:sigma-70 family RNA polymerase sigma factor [Bacteroides sp.]
MLRISGKHPDKTDEELLGNYLSSGDLQWLGDLYARYMHMVYGVSLKYLENRDEAKDAVMQIFEQLVTDLPRHRIRNFRSWLFVLTKNHCLMQLRAAKRMRGKLEEIKNGVAFVESEEELHPIDREDPDVGDALRECIDALRNEQKQCIQLFYEQKLCYREISEKLRMEEKKVKSHLQNGKRNLKICLEKKNVR